MQAKIQELAELKGAQWQAKAGLRGVQAKEKQWLCLCKTYTD
jgi:hypothetical protein